MRSLLSGYAGAFNRRHRRSEHLFQNRYRSAVSEEESYFLELVRYLHLNPLRAGLVKDMRGLAWYRYNGHTTLVGPKEYSGQKTKAVLGQFATNEGRARQHYLSSGGPTGRAGGRTMVPGVRRKVKP